MSSPITQKLIDYVLSWTGIQLEVGKQPLLEQRLKRLLDEHGLHTGNELAEALQSKMNKSLMDQFLSAVTINETLWFRDDHPFEAMLELIQKYIDKKGRAIIWSAACSYGQEPYSLAIQCSERNLDRNIKIYASDLDQGAIEHAKAGRYDNFAMNRGMKQNYLQKYFRKNEDVWEIQDQIKKLVHFKSMNLTELQPWPEPIDIILLRNVMIYFPKDKKKEILAGVVSKLSKEGSMIVGGCETLIGLHPSLKMKSIGKSIYYSL